MYWHRTPQLIQWLYPNLIWHKSRKEKTLYVTFDDGPVPEVTPLVLKILNDYNAKATFFCVGDNIAKHQSVYDQVVQNGHSTANHTYNHLNSWNTKTNKYLANVKQSQTYLKPDLEMGRKPLFRPPYGKIKRRAVSKLSSKYEIVMWDVLAGDFDKNITPEQCLTNTIKSTRSGSIIIFHDSLKAKNNMLYALPKFLEHFSNLGYKFKSL